MPETHLETFSLVIVTAIVLAIVQEIVRKVMSPKKDINASTVFVTRQDMETFCKTNQDKCAALKIVSMIEKNMDEFRKELKQEMQELRRIVSKALLHED